MTQVRRLAPTALGATVLMIVLLGVRPVPASTILAGYALALAAILLTGLTASITASRHDAPSRFEAELARRRVPPTRPPELVRVERELTLASAHALQFHHRLRPLLREVALARLGRDFGPERLAPSTWDLLRPDAGPPTDPDKTGPSLASLTRVIDELERL